MHEHAETLKRPQRTVSTVSLRALRGARLRVGAPQEDDNPQAVKRNKRMFGALLGTLQKFRRVHSMWSTFCARSQRLARSQARRRGKRAQGHRRQARDDAAAGAFASCERSRARTYVS